jgi:hypothetical protein
MTEEPPLDLLRVAADDVALDRVRDGAVSPGHDVALGALRDLLVDVESDLPADRVVRGPGSDVLPLSGPAVRGRRLVRRSAAVGVLTAGVLSLGGVAAATTVAPAGSPLHGLGQAVRSAAGAVAGAVTPPGRDVAAEARSLAAARQVDRLLDAAAALLDNGRTASVEQRLDTAERLLADVRAQDRGDRETRLADLRTRLAALTAGTPAKPGKVEPRVQGPRGTGPEAPKSGQRRAEPKGGQPGAPAPRAEAPAEPAPAGRGAEKPGPQPRRSGERAESKPEPAPESESESAPESASKSAPESESESESDAESERSASQTDEAEPGEAAAAGPRLLRSSPHRGR